MVSGEETCLFHQRVLPFFRPKAVCLGPPATARSLSLGMPGNAGGKLQCPPLHLESEVDIFTYKLATESSVYTEVERILSKLPNWQATKGTRFNLLLAERWDVDYSCLGLIPGLVQRVNHIRGTRNITIKALMVKTLRSYAEACKAQGFPEQAPQIIPETFLLVPGCSKGCERELLEEVVARSPGGEPAIWICKATAGAHGKDIFISGSIKEVLCYVDGFAPAASKGGQAVELPLSVEAAKRKRPASWLVQRYIEQPLLYRGRKFDIRALVCALDGGKVYWYKKWIARTCSLPYSLDNLASKVAHVTNHSIQREAQEFSAHEEGNEIFTDDLGRHFMNELGEDRGREVLCHIIRQMQSAVRQTLMAIPEVFDGASKPYSSFQLLGYDFMVDNTYRVWLLECNGSPACASRMLRTLAEDTVKCAVINAFLPVDHKDAASEVVGDFELIADLSAG